jgi:hypothetical protein
MNAASNAFPLEGMPSSPIEEEDPQSLAVRAMILE